ncbi:MAG: hypothetical protein LBG43_00005, partial [Treponema sp.]|nr:hypothetical protein [Treponema sp.]
MKRFHPQTPQVRLYQYRILNLFPYTVLLLLDQLELFKDRQHRSRFERFTNFKPPALPVVSDYGGKQTLSAVILGLIPERRITASLYEALRRGFTSLEKEIAISLHSRKKHHQSQVIYANPEMFDRVKRSWAVRTPAKSSYGC